MAVKTSPSPSRSSPARASKQRSRDADLLNGLNTAGIAFTVLGSTYSLLQVDVFLKVYDLSPTIYSVGRFIISLMDALVNVVAAYSIDRISLLRGRSEFIAPFGCLFAVCFVLPFYRWAESQGWFLDGLHFILTSTLYNAAFSLTNLLVNSAIAEHRMTYGQRVYFQASSKVISLLCSFFVIRWLLLSFQVELLKLFRTKIVICAIVSCFVFWGAEFIIRGGSVNYRQRPFFRTQRQLHAHSHQRPHTVSYPESDFARAIQEFWSHKNFKAWAATSMLLNAQYTFVLTFFKTFVDGILFEGGVSSENCARILSVSRPTIEIVTVLCYVPMRRYGYAPLYKLLFIINLGLSTTVFFFAGPNQTTLVGIFLIIYSSLSGAVQVCGYQLALTDLILERKIQHAKEGRFDEASLSALFMGITAVLCKPMESILPIIAATILDRAPDPRFTLFYLLVGPPIIFSILQLVSWNHFHIDKRISETLHDELDESLNRNSPEKAIHTEESILFAELI